MANENMEALLARRTQVLAWIAESGKHEPQQYLDRLYSELRNIDAQLSSNNVFTDSADAALPAPFEAVSRATT